MTNDYNVNQTTQEAPQFVDKQKVDMFLMANQKYFPAEQILLLRDKLYSLDDATFTVISCAEKQDPTTLLIISILLGSWGIDRFMLKETGMGVLKLLTGGCCGVLTIIDWFTIQKKTKEHNFNNLMQMLMF